MPFNGSGTFSRLYNWEADRDANIKIQAARMDAEMDGFATALSETFLRDGRAAMSGTLLLGGNRVTGLANGAVATPAIAFANSTTSGLYYTGTNVAVAHTGTKIAEVSATGVSVTGTFAASGNSTVGGTFGVTGATTLSSTLAVSSNATVGGTLGVTGAATLSSTLNVVGNTIVSTLVVDGALDVNSTSDFAGNVAMSGTLGVTGLATLGSASVTGNATVGGTLGVTGASTFTGAITANGGITGAVTSSNVTITGGNISGIVDLAVADGGTGASSAGAARTNLGLGTAATQATGTSGNTVPFLDGTNTWSGTQTGTFALAHASTIKDSDGNTFEVGYRNIPVLNKSADYTLALGDAGKSVVRTAGNLTIPANASVAFPIGTVVTGWNNAATSMTVSITTDTMYLEGTGGTGTRTVAAYGMFTLHKVASTSWVIAGGNVT